MSLECHTDWLMDKLSIVGNLPLQGMARISIVDGLIEAVEMGEFKPQEADLYLPDCFLVPGFIDLQINGGLGHDFTLDPNSVYELAKQLPRWGCTAFLPTIITSEFGAYQHSLKLVKEAMQEATGARVLGAHLEGPYLNRFYKGAHDSNYLRSPSVTEVASLLESGSLRMFTLAPELPGALEMIEYLVKRGVRVAAGHTGATYEEGRAAFLAGASYVTHLFNAMPSIHHRRPGIIAAALDPILPHRSRPYVGVIADGIHVHPAVLRLLGDTPLTLVTDAMAGMGMPSGQYKLAGLDVIVDETSARLNDGKKTLAGSILTIDQAVRNAMVFLNLSLPKAVSLVSTNPAAFLGKQGKLGALEQGYRADLVVLDQSMQVHLTVVGGQIVYQRGDAAKEPMQATII